MTKKIWKSPLKHRRSFSQKLFNHQKHLKHSNNQFVSYGQSPNLQNFFGILCSSLRFERRVAIFPMVSPFWWPPSLILQTLVENLVEPWVVFSLSFYFIFNFFCCLQKWSSFFFFCVVVYKVVSSLEWGVLLCFIFPWWKGVHFSSRNFFPIFSSFPYCANQTCP